MVPHIDPIQVKAELSRRSLFYFVREFWPEIIHEDPVWNWHIPYLCDELQKIAERVFKGLPKEADVIINIPPGTTKSTIASVMFPVWTWTRAPHIRLITGSYASSISTEQAIKARDIIRSEKFRLYFPEIEMKMDKDGKTSYGNTMNGSRTSVSVGSAVTGTHAHIIIIDDPVNPKQASSDAERQTANDWMTQTLSTRKVDKAVTPTILIMQRLHEHDPTGHLLKKAQKEGKKIHHICLPATLSDRVSPVELRDKYEDCLLDPIRMPYEVLEDIRLDLGSYGYAGQFDQTPAPDEGGLLKKHWFKVIQEEDLPDGLTWNFKIDPAYTANENNDPSALMSYAMDDRENIYIRAVEEVFLEFPELISKIKTFTAFNGYTGASRIAIEPKASGKSLVQTLRKQTGLNVVEDLIPTKDKTARVRDISPKVEAGKVHLVSGPWVEKFILQCAQFPNASHDDQVDCLVMALNDKHSNWFVV